MQNRELTLDDYLAMLRRRWKIILVPTLLAPLAGFGVSFLFQPKYTSQATVLVEEPRVQEGYVSSVITQDLSSRVATLEQRALTGERLYPLIENLKLAEGSAIGSKMEEIRQNIDIQPMPAITLPSMRGDGRKGQAPGFNLEYTTNNPHEAQNVCTGLLNIMLQENLKDRAQVAQQTNEFLAHQIEDEKHKLDDMDNKLADFKKRYIGQLPGDADKNMQLLLTLNSQLDANTQALNRAQQDKTYTESLLSQQLAAWKASQNASGANPQTLDKQLSDLQSQLLTLKTRYTDNYPEVMKTKRDIQELQKQIEQAN
ncbi:MAG: lipopolysaccharide biosynthesis protein, partial [Acidobacteria bacterium]|nr:lipopolysaccharide biosynthesis protein [Acidobacteriota bacterium]